MTGRREQAYLAALLAAAAAVGLARLATPALWLDEAVSWFNSSGTWQRVLERAVAGDDTGGILYAALLKTWIPLAGDSEFALRLPSVVAMIALVAVMWQAARSLWGERAALAVGALTLFHPSVLASGRQARGYVFILLFTAACLLGLVWLRLGRRRAGSLLLAAASLGVAATHVLGIAVAAGTAAAAVTIAWSRERGAPAPDRTASAIRATAPFAPAFAFAGWWLTSLAPTLDNRLATFWTPATTLAGVSVVVVLMGVPLLLGALFVFIGDREHGRETAVGLVLIAAPVVLAPGLASVLARGDHAFLTVRYTLPLVPLATLACGYAVSRLGAQSMIRLLLLMAALSISYAVSKNVYSAPLRAGQDLRAAVQFVRAERRPGDQVVVVPAWEWFSLAYYGVRTASTPPGAVRGGEPASGGSGGATWTVLFHPAPDHGTLPPPGTFRFGTMEVVYNDRER